MAGSVGQYTQSWLPWQAVKAATGTWSRTNNSSSMGMGWWQNNGTQALNDDMSLDLWLDTGTWKICLVAAKDASHPIITFLIDGSSVGTVDTYSATNTQSVYTEITGISVTTASLKSLVLRAASKNASATAYLMQIQSIGLFRTGGASSVPAGSDTPGYTWQVLPWTGNKNMSNMGLLMQFSARLGGGYAGAGSDGGPTAFWECDLWIDSGTYKVAMAYATGSAAAIISQQLNGTTKATIDTYAATSTDNNYSEVTGIALTAGVATFRAAGLSKNASSTFWEMYIHSLAWIRTGA